MASKIALCVLLSSVTALPKVYFGKEIFGTSGDEGESEDYGSGDLVGRSATDCSSESSSYWNCYDELPFSASSTITTSTTTSTVTTSSIMATKPAIMTSTTATSAKTYATTTLTTTTTVAGNFFHEIS